MTVFYSADAQSSKEHSRFLRLFENFGQVQEMVWETFLWSRKCARDRKLLLEQCTVVGAQSVVVVCLIACSVGMVLALQSAYQLSKFHAERYIGALVSLSMAKELGPLMTALLIAGRAGAAMAGHNVAILGNHGEVTVGKDFREAIQRALFFELACTILFKAGDQATRLSQRDVASLQAI